MVEEGAAVEVEKGAAAAEEGAAAEEAAAAEEEAAVAEEAAAAEEGVVAEEAAAGVPPVPLPAPSLTGKTGKSGPAGCHVTDKTLVFPTVLKRCQTSGPM